MWWLNKCEHKEVTKIKEEFDSNLNDNYYATNFGGPLIQLGYDICICDNCKQEIRKLNNKRKIDGREF